jgi:hypothetical protein
MRQILAIVKNRFLIFLRDDRIIIIQIININRELKKIVVRCYETLVIDCVGPRIVERTVSSHFNGPSKWISTQHGVHVTA